MFKSFSFAILLVLTGCVAQNPNMGVTSPPMHMMSRHPDHSHNPSNHPQRDRPYNGPHPSYNSNEPHPSHMMNHNHGWWTNSPTNNNNNVQGNPQLYYTAIATSLPLPTDHNRVSRHHVLTILVIGVISAIVGVLAIAFAVHVYLKRRRIVQMSAGHAGVFTEMKGNLVPNSQSDDF
eukprot:PhF_6_TR32633/c0_g1_i1/m.48242